tara:strand:- start:1174 stop:1554 length:381 start_codon:yes stop_codon:yes gene_type:complete
MLTDELGTSFNFKRDIEQYRERDLGDVISDNDKWPFLIECKRRKNGTTYSMDWVDQAKRAAEKCNKIPVVIYQLMRSPIRCVVDLNVILKAFDCPTACFHENLIELPLETFCMIAREIMQDEVLAL